MDDLSFDILEALKNVDEVKEEENSSSKKRKTHNSFTNRTREVMMDEDSEEESSPPKVSFCWQQILLQVCHFGDEGETNLILPSQKLKPAVLSTALMRSLPKSTRIMFTPSSDNQVDYSSADFHSLHILTSK